MPAVFLYSPNFVYVVSKDTQGIKIDHITSPKDRFLNVYVWYTKTDNVWKVFSKQNQFKGEIETRFKLLLRIKINKNT